MNWKPIETVVDCEAMDTDAIVQGYMDGMRGTVDHTRKDQAYWHGQGNADVDRGRCVATVHQSKLAQAYVDRWRSH